jgi:hypothetical protein
MARRSLHTVRTARTFLNLSLITMQPLQLNIVAATMVQAFKLADSRDDRTVHLRVEATEAAEPGTADRANAVSGSAGLTVREVGHPGSFDAASTLALTLSDDPVIDAARRLAEVLRHGLRGALWISSDREHLVGSIGFARCGAGVQAIARIEGITGPGPV